MNDKYQDIIDRVKEIDSILTRQGEKLDKMNDMLDEILNSISSNNGVTDAVRNMWERYKTYNDTIVDGPR